MKHIFLLLLTTLYLFAVQEKKIILATYFNEKEAMQGLKKSTDAFENDFYALQQDHNFSIALYSSKSYYILVLRPFKNITAARKILPYAKRAYSSSFISNHLKDVNQLISTITLEAPPKVETIKKETPIILQTEFLKPITINEILSSSKPKDLHPKSTSSLRTTHVKPTNSFNSIFYFFYALLSMLIIALLVMILKNNSLKRRIQNHDNILKENFNHVDKDNMKGERLITSVELSEYIHNAFINKANPLNKIQNSVDDILNVDALLHGKSYIKNREFQLSEITLAIAKRHHIIFNVDEDIPKTLIGDIDIIERIFLRLSYMSYSTVSIIIATQDEECIEVEFLLDNMCEENNPVDTSLIIQLLNFIDGTFSINECSDGTKSIKSFRLSFKLVQDSNFRVKRP